jgi:putative tryptophan/tyrosine transport system substrate-binding protein
MHMKKNSFILVALIVLALAGLWFKRNGDTGRKTIAVVTLMSHPALDSLKDAALKELAAKGFSDTKVKFIFRNANGQVNEAATIANSLLADNPDAVIAITTPMAQAVVAAKLQCPVIFAAVTDPVGAKLVSSLDNANGNANITGTSDAWPYEDQLILMKEITPNARRVGVLYNPGEAASQYGIKEIRRLAAPMNLILVEGAVSTMSEVRAVTETINDQVDAFFLSSDNTVIGGMTGALKVAIEKKKPLYVGDSGTVEKGGLAAVSVGYVELGRMTGSLAARMLNGERNIPVYVGRGTDTYVNLESATRMGVEIPESVKKRAAKVFTKISE